MQKILILGATYTENVIIDRARLKGLYTIVTDNNLDYSKSPAKYYADEAWDISWSDIDVLYTKCKENNVCAVLAGFSEFRVECMIKLCTRLGLPCYITLEQLEITRDKQKFKSFCNKFNLSCIPEYKYGEDISFPVIVKPVDRAGSIGINVVYDKSTLEQSYQYALSLSPTKNVIIEQFIDNGIKVDSYYYVLNGRVTLLGTSDTIMCEGTDAAPILQKGWVFPSIYEKKYLAEVDDKVREMLKGLDYRNGYVTFSTFFVDNKFYFFEAGFRLSGEMSFNYYNCLKGVNYIDLLIDYSLGVESNLILEDVVDSKAHSVILNFFGRSGTIEYLALPDVTNCESFVAKNIYICDNDTISNDTNVLKKVAMYTLFSDDKGKIVEDIKFINDSISIKSTYNKELIYEKVDANILGYSDLLGIGGVKILLRPYYVTWVDIQKLLAESHQTNISLGLMYATATQSVEKLKEKCSNAEVVVVLERGRLLGTGTIQYRNIKHWYHNGSIGLLKLIAVSPTKQGSGIGFLLFKELLKRAQCIDKDLVVVVDSAEQNIGIKKLSLNSGFKKVDCCLYKENNFYSTVYAKWLGENQPWYDWYISLIYNIRRFYVHLKYKPGKILRFKWLTK